jgi:hypothetical protein
LPGLICITSSRGWKQPQQPEWWFWSQGLVKFKANSQLPVGSWWGQIGGTVYQCQTHLRSWYRVPEWQWWSHLLDSSRVMPPTKSIKPLGVVMEWLSWY